MSDYTRPERLIERHILNGFDCGVEALNVFLKRYALQNQKSNAARTFVTSRSETAEVVGFYSLCAASVEFEQTPDRIRKGLARHEVPVILLARLGVDRDEQGKGLGVSLLLDAFGRFMTAQETIGARALLAHAKDESAKAFYERWGFVASEGLPLHLYLLTKDIKATLESL